MNKITTKEKLIRFRNLLVKKMEDSNSNTLTSYYIDLIVELAADESSIHPYSEAYDKYEEFLRRKSELEKEQERFYMNSKNLNRFVAITESFKALDDLNCITTKQACQKFTGYEFYYDVLRKAYKNELNKTNTKIKVKK